MTRPDRTATARRTAPPRGGRTAIGVAVTIALVLATVVALVAGTGGGETTSTVAFDRETQVLEFTATTFDGETVASQRLRGTCLLYTSPSPRDS